MQSIVQSFLAIITVFTSTPSPASEFSSLSTAFLGNSARPSNSRQFQATYWGSVTGIISAQMGQSFKGITEIAPGLIALTIGGEFSVAKIKQTGLNILTPISHRSP